MTPLLTQLHTRIAELVPEVKKLSFGCEIEIKDYDNKYGDEYPLNQTILYITHGEYGESDDVFTVHGCLEYEFEIIGHPIILADVLRAIIKVSPPFSQNIILSSKDVKEILAIWNLALDLDDQSPEVHEFIASIIL